MPALIQLFASFHLKVAAFSFSDGLQDWSSQIVINPFLAFSFLNSSQIYHILQTFSNSQRRIQINFLWQIPNLFCIFS